MRRQRRAVCGPFRWRTSYKYRLGQRVRARGEVGEVVARSTNRWGSRHYWIALDDGNIRLAREFLVLPAAPHER